MACNLYTKCYNSTGFIYCITTSTFYLGDPPRILSYVMPFDKLYCDLSVIISQPSDWSMDTPHWQAGPRGRFIRDYTSPKGTATTWWCIRSNVKLLLLQLRKRPGAHTHNNRHYAPNLQQQLLLIYLLHFFWHYNQPQTWPHTSVH